MPEPTSEQSDLITGPSDIFVEACAGAGKTQAIVHRYRTRAEAEKRKGIALLSFTNVAVDEVRARCADDPSCMQAPNFVGTFDGFINRYITGPLFAREQRKQLTFVESWDVLPRTLIRSSDYRLGFKLEWFSFSDSGAASFEPQSVRANYKAEILKKADEFNTEICSRATNLRSQLLFKKALASSSASRWYAAGRLQKPVEAALMSRLLSHRFSEIVVDEAQDCGVEEIAILKFIRSSGIKVTLVADRDQAIFEFRRATPSGLSDFTSALQVGVRLGGNFRSTPAICRINDSLRFAADKDVAIGVRRDSTLPVQILTYSRPGDVAGSVVPTLDKYGFAAKDAIVIAHARRLASEAAGDTTPSDKLGTNRIILVAEASQLLRARTVNPRIKLKAITKAQWILLGLVSGLAATHLTLESACGEAGLKMDWLREAALRLALAADPSTLGPRDYAKAVRTTVDQLTWPAHVQRPSLNSHFRTPNSDQWSELGVEPSGGMRWGTVHSVKGQEFPAVIVVLPQKMIKDSSGLSVLDQWEQGVDAEPRRVLYVAASRAQSLLILATYKSHIGRVRAILTRDNVPFSLVAQ